MGTEQVRLSLPVATGTQSPVNLRNKGSAADGGAYCLFCTANASECA